MKLDPNNPVPGGSDTGLSNTDNITNDTQPFFVVSSIEANAQEVILLRSTSANGTYSLVNTAAPPTFNGDGTVSIQDTNNGNGPVQPDGTYYYEIEQVDIAGNTSQHSAPLSVLVVTATPGTPALTLASDSGVKGDNVTNVTSPSFTVTGLTGTPTFPADGPYQAILLRSTTGAAGTFTPVATAAANTAGTATIKDPSTDQPDGFYYYEVEQEDVAGNVSLPSAPLQILVVTGRPSTPSFVFDPSSDSGVKGDHITNVTNPKFDVSGVTVTPPFPADGPAQVVLLRATSLSGPFNTIAVLGGGNSGAVTIQDTGPLSGNPPVGGVAYYYEVEQEDAAGNVSNPSAPFQLTVKTAAQTPTGLALDPASESGIAGSNITAVTNPVFDVSNIEAAAQQVILLRSTSPSGPFTQVSAIPSLQGGTVSIQDPGPVQPDGTYYYEVEQVDVAGNTSAPSAPPLAITFNTTPPPVTTAPTLAPGSDTGVSNSDRLTSDNGSAQAPLTFTVNVTGSPSVTNGFVRLFDVTSGTPVLIGGPVLSVNGVATITVNNQSLADGTHRIVATVAANATSTQSALSPSTSVAIQSSTLFTGDSLTSNFFTSAPGPLVFHFNHPLAGLTPDVADGTGFTSDPFAVMLIPSGPDGAATQAQTGSFWSGPNGADGGDLPIHSTLVYHVNPDGTSEITLTPTVPLGTNLYLLSVQGQTLTDLAGNPVTVTGGKMGPFYDSFDLRLPPVSTGAPQVLNVTTNNGATTIVPGTNPTITQPDTIAIQFSKAMDFYNINSSTIFLQALPNGTSNLTTVPSIVTYSPATQTAYLTPTAFLSPGTKYIITVSGSLTDDEGFPTGGFAIGANYFSSFFVNTNPVTPSSGPFVVTATTPMNGSLVQQQFGYVSVTFSAPLSTEAITRFDVMLTPNPAAPNDFVPVNAKIAFNPNTDQLIIVPTDVLGQAIDYLGLSNLNAANLDGSPNVNAPLLNNAGLPAGVGANKPYFATWELSPVVPLTVRHSVSAADFVAVSPSTPSSPVVVTASATSSTGATPDASVSIPGRVSARRVPQSIAEAKRSRVRLTMREGAIESNSSLWLAALEDLASEPMKRARRV